MNVESPTEINLTTKYTALFKTGAVFISSVAVITLATREIFTLMGLSPPKILKSGLAYLFTTMTSIALTSAIVARLGWTVPPTSEMMSSKEISATFRLCFPLTIACSLAIHNHKIYTPQHPIISQIQIGALFLPLALLISEATECVFEACRWETSDNNRFFTKRLVTQIIAGSIATAVTVKFKWIQSFHEGFSDCLLISCYLIGLSFMKQALENIALGTNHRLF